MEELRQQFREFVGRERLFAPGDKLLLACSGGLDSTVLAHLLKDEGYDFAIAHMNYRLRGEASDGEADFVKELARTLDAKFWYKAVDVVTEAQKHESTQMTARRLRYEWFDQLRNTHGYRYLLTAHHADDSLETFLMQLIRGRKFSAPSPIYPRNGELRRPLLGCSRQQIGDYARARGVSWREDASNASDAYLRNQVRHHLTPLLREHFGLRTKNWAHTQRQIWLDGNLRNLGLQQLRHRHLRTDGEVLTLDREGLEHTPELLRDAASCRFFTPEQQRQMLTAAGNAVVESHRWRAFVTPSAIRFELRDDPQPLPVLTVPGFPYFGNELTLELVDRPEELDADDRQFIAALSPPLYLRPRRNGDRFQPLGMGGKTKKVQDYFVDQKVPVWLRDGLYLLVNAADEIVAIPGYCISEKFRVRTTDERVLQIRPPGTATSA